MPRDANQVGGQTNAPSEQQETSERIQLERKSRSGVEQKRPVLAAETNSYSSVENIGHPTQGYISLIESNVHPDALIVRSLE